MRITFKQFKKKIINPLHNEGIAYTVFSMPFDGKIMINSLYGRS
jgi:hypothetical protein